MDIGDPTDRAAAGDRGPPAANDDIDDIWGDGEPTQTPAIRRIHMKQGYVDGLAHAQEASLQAGFDEGYAAGAQLGVDVGRVLARTWGTPAHSRAADELRITEVLSRRWFDHDLSTAEHDLVKRWLRETGLA